ncbi:hypothetical protein H2199_005288 [Coniosporium tulheliwenetii]|nr:hypothetical protein H2199_005288 [Cladosporium sp. JES 115]
MSDPPSVTAGVVGITAICLKTAKALRNLTSKYEDAAITIAAIISESTIISASLSKIQSLLLDTSDAFTGGLNARSELHATFDTALIGCIVVFSCLENEVKQLSLHAEHAHSVDWKSKAKAVWKDDQMKELLESLRGQQNALTLLMQGLQM